MDGNGRWARQRGLPRVAGHREGAKAVRRVVEACPAAGISTLTLYAFSSDNWQRPPAEVATLMALFRNYLTTESQRCRREGVRISVIGRRDRLPSLVVAAMEETEAYTAAGTVLHLRIAIDYSARDAILAAARTTDPRAPATREEFSRHLHQAMHSDLDTPDVDLLVRTSGEQRLSDFLLWESAYAELVFTPRMWPDFAREDLEEAIGIFRARERRFGAVHDEPETALPEYIGQLVSQDDRTAAFHNIRGDRWLR
jgi:undecaprenyl diphosphate synthase